MSVLETIKDYGNLMLDSFKLYEREPDEIITERDMDNLYQARRSFIDYLPFEEYIGEHEAFLLDDQKSYAFGLDLIPKNSEGVSLESMELYRNSLQELITQIFPLYEECPWQIQTYQSDTLSLEHYVDTIKGHIQSDELHEDPVTKEIVGIVEQHLSDICKDGGLFKDDLVTNSEWRGSVRNYRMFVYRKYSPKAKQPEGLSPLEEMLQLRDELEGRLLSNNIVTSRVTGEIFYKWMFRWFNPKPDLTNGDTEALLKDRSYPGDNNLPIGHDLAESLFVSLPERDRDPEKGCFYFDGIPHTSISVNNIRKAPKMGAITAPKQIGEYVSAVADSMPEGTITVMNITLLKTSVIEDDVIKVRNSARGVSNRIQKVRDECDKVDEWIGNDENVPFPVEIAFLIRAEDHEQIRKVKNNVISEASKAGLNCINSLDYKAQDTYLISMPMAYDYARAKKNDRTFLCSAQHLANLMPLFGRGRGTGTPGMLWFNRGGEPMMIDPLHSADRSKNAHLLLFGPTGAGKSASLIAMMIYYIAIYNPRVYGVEAGGSFDMLVTYLASRGKSTHKVQIKAGSKDANIAPFANAIKALEQEEKSEAFAQSIIDDTYVDPLDELKDKYDGPSEFGEVIEEDDEVKDYIGELELMARLMITGGDKDQMKGFKVSDQQYLIESILDAARYVREQGLGMVKPSHVAEQLLIKSKVKGIPEAVKEKLYEYAASIRKFTQGEAGLVFNSDAGEWKEADFTHVDLRNFSREGKETELAMAYISIVQRVNEIAERDQDIGRPILFITDEAHLITKNPLLAPAVVKIVKMWRKLGAWMWLATQNLEDFPDDAAMMLSLCEWWLCLACEADEVKKISRFKSLSEEQEQLLLQAKKHPKRHYTEGVVLSTNVQEIFRAVPPSKILAIGQSENDEKRARKKIMEEHGVDVVSAAFIVAEELDRERGIVR